MFDTKKSYKSSADVVDGKLILSFPNATSPVVWQMDLQGHKASALEVKAQDDTAVLLLKTAKGETIEIAAFATHEDAVDGLMKASNAMKNASGQIHVAINQNEGNVYSTSRKAKSWGKLILKGLGILVALYIAALVLGVLFGGGSSSSPRSVSGQSMDGVPMSADEFLQQQ